MLGEVVWGLFLWTKHIKIIIRCSRKREIKSSLGSCIIIIIIIVLLLKCPVINSEKISLQLFEQRTSIHRRWRIMGVLSCKTRLKHFCVTCTTSGYIHESNFNSCYKSFTHKAHNFVSMYTDKYLHFFWQIKIFILLPHQHWRHTTVQKL